MVAVIEASAFAETIAAPTPCPARAVNSCQSSCAAPAATEAAMNSPSPAMSIRRRPMRSPARPQTMSRLPNVTV
jgi:hypothetical protein